MYLHGHTHMHTYVYRKFSVKGPFCSSSASVADTTEICKLCVCNFDCNNLVALGMLGCTYNARHFDRFTRTPRAGSFVERGSQQFCHRLFLCATAFYCAAATTATAAAGKTSRQTG